MRYGRKDAEAAFKGIMRAIGGDYNINDVYAVGMTTYDDEANSHWRGIVGRYALDYAACYGGYRIVRCANGGGRRARGNAAEDVGAAILRGGRLHGPNPGRQGAELMPNDKSVVCECAHCGLMRRCVFWWRSWLCGECISLRG